MVQKDKALEAPPVDSEQSPSPVSGEACAEAPGPVEDSGLAVEPTGLRKFISGVVEGNVNNQFIGKRMKVIVYFIWLCMYAASIKYLLLNLCAVASHLDISEHISYM